MSDSLKSIYEILQIAGLDAPLPALKSTWVAVTGWETKDYELNTSTISALRLAAVSLYEYGHTTSEMSEILQDEFAKQFSDIDVSIGWPKQEENKQSDTNNQGFDILITAIPL
jgi:hypothetical protein